MEYTLTGSYTDKSGTKIPFHYTDDIPLEKKLELVKDVVNTATSDAIYVDLLEEIYFNFDLVNYFTDIDTSSLFSGTSPADIGPLEELLNDTDLAAVLRESIKPDVLKKLEQAVDHGIACKTGYHRDVVSEAIASFLKSASDFVGHMDQNYQETLTPEALKRLTEMAGRFSALDEKEIISNLIETIHAKP